MSYYVKTVFVLPKKINEFTVYLPLGNLAVLHKRLGKLLGGKNR